MESAAGAFHSDIPLSTQLLLAVVRPVMIDAREHSHLQCDAYACEKVIPRAASASRFGMRNDAVLLAASPGIMGTEVPFHAWSSTRMKTKFGGGAGAAFAAPAAGGALADSGGTPIAAIARMEADTRPRYRSADEVMSVAFSLRQTPLAPESCPQGFDAGTPTPTPERESRGRLRLRLSREEPG